MTIRLNNPSIDDTKKLLEEVLSVVVRDESRVLFLCEPGTGPAVVQRLRVMISRKRMAMQAKGRRVRRFRLHSSFHAETHEGKRFDACVLWHEQSETSTMLEDLERMLCNG